METKQILLTRDEFRNAVFERDNHKCVICGEPGVDSHHILERRLFHDYGYYIDNGSTLCTKHHLEAEMTTLGCDEIREACGIKKIVLPDHLYDDQEYDKWGNCILANGTRTKGDLFEDESVQKILGRGKVLDLFTDEIKYPRTYHLEWSPGITRDDRIMPGGSSKNFEGKEVVIFEKLDGENTTMYPHKMHARSLDSGSHESRNYVKNIWAQMGYEIPVGWRLCGENMFAKHALYYTNKPVEFNAGDSINPRMENYPGGNALKEYFYAFSIWDEFNYSLDWDTTLEYLELLGIEPCPVIYRGIWDMKVIEKLNKFIEKNPDLIEGYVVRINERYHYSQFKKMNGKYVRKNHVCQNHGHWMSRKVTKNELRKEGEYNWRDKITEILK